MPNAPTPNHSELTAEQQAALLKARDHALGKLGETVEGSEAAPIAWETGLSGSLNDGTSALSGGAHPGTPGAPVAERSQRPDEGRAPDGGHALELTPPLAAPAPPSVADGAPAAGMPPPGLIGAWADGRVGGVAAPLQVIGGRELAAGAALAAESAVPSSSGTVGSEAKTANPAAAAVGSGNNGNPQIPPLEISGAVSGAIDEDGVPAIGGTLFVSGGAPGPHRWALGSAKGQYGSFDLGPDGQWHYHLDNSLPAVQALPAGQHATDHGLALVTDTAGQTRLAQIVITITGTNDAALISGVDTLPVKEDEHLMASGKLDITDVDSGEAQFVALTQAAGAHGTLDLQPDGTWTYHLDTAQPAIQALKTGDTTDDTFTVSSKDGTTHQITVTIQGTDDQAVIRGTATGRITEDTQPGISGKLDIIDPDAGQAAFTPLDHAAGQHGEFVVAADGHWTYTLNNADGAVQALRPGDTPLIDTLTVTSQDGSATQTLTVFIQGTNDAPTLQATRQQTQEDDPIIHGQLIGHDIDQTDRLVYGTTAQVPGFTLHADGSYEFDPHAPAWQHFAAGKQYALNIPVTVTDEAGASQAQTLQIILSGTNDAPQLTVLPPLAVLEGNPVFHGQLTALDVDDHDTQTYRSTVPVAGFALHADGSYTFDPADPAYEHLAVGQKQVIQIPVEVIDSTGATASQTLQITITGTNDAALISGVDTLPVKEDEHLMASGKLDITDVDSGEAQFVALTQAAGAHGTLDLQPDGTWTYHLDTAQPAIQALKTGDTTDDTFTVSSKDGTTHQITVTIQGTDDQAVIRGTATGRVTEDTQPGISGKLDIIDPDAGQAAFTPLDHAAGQHGEFVVAADGHWTYTLNNADGAVQALRPGDTPLTDTLTVTSQDGSATQTLTVFIQGTNDAPTLQATRQQFNEGDPVYHGQIVGHDTDSSDILVYGAPAVLPGFTLHADGSYDFDPNDPAWQHFAAHQQYTLDIPVTVTDQAGARAKQTLQIVVTGTNDAPELLVMPPATVLEGAPAIHNRLVAQDVDDFDTLTYRATAPVAGFTLHADGSYEFNPADPAYDHLAYNQKQVLNIPVEVADASGATASRVIEITVIGSNDAPILAMTPPRSVAEGAAVIDGQLTATDPDTGDMLTYSLGQPVPGLTLDASGHYRFDPADTHYDSLAVGQQAVLNVPLIVTDAHGGSSTGQLQITLTGTNDAPLITGTAVAGLTENAAIHSVTHTLAVTDVDTGDTASWVLLGSGQGVYGQLVFNAQNHQWTYTLDNADADTDALHAGQHVTEIFRIAATDKAGATVTREIRVNIAGANDAPTITGTTSGTVIESDAAHATIGGTLTHADVDSADTFQWSLANGRGTYGALTFDAASGHWAYTLDESRAATQGLNAGQTVTETFTVTGVDKAGARVTQAITVTVQGTNDNPAVNGAHEGSVVEDRTLLASGTLTSTDSDRGDTPAAWQVLSPQGSYGALTINAQGGWTYQLDAAASQSLKAGATADERFVVRVTDHHGGTADQVVTIHVTGSNDAPAIEATQAALHGEVTEDQAGKLTTGGTLASGDPDVGDTLTWGLAGLTGMTKVGQYGTFTLCHDDTWSYTLDHAKADVLPEGANVTETFYVYVTDAAGERSKAAVTVRVHGTNDGPAIGGQTSGDVTENSAPVARGTLASGDPDHPDPGTWSIVGNGAGQFGSLSLDNAGHWTYTLANSPTVETLGAGEKVQETFAVKVVDSHGLESTHQITINVHGSNDAPLIAGTTSGQVAEDILSQVSGSLTATDLDRTDHPTFDATTFIGNYGELSIDKAGQWTYALLPTDPHVQALAAGQTVVETFNVAAFDAHGGVTYQPVTITVVGTNDAPHIGGVSTGIALANVIDTAHGRLVGYDKDIGDTGAWSLANNHGRYGDLTLDAQGEWTYQLDLSRPETRNLQAGQQVSESFTVRLTDHEGAQDTSHINITVFGTQQNTFLTTATPGGTSATQTHPHPVTGAVPLVIPPISASVTEDMLPQQSGRLPALGPASGGFSWQVSPMTGVFGDLTLDSHGHWQYQLHNGAPQVQALSAGQTVQEHFSVNGHNSSGQQVQTQLVVDIHGTDDKPQIIGVTTGVAVEDTHTSVSGNLDLLDVDATDHAQWQALDTQGRYGAFSLDQSGHWHYQLDPNLAQGLNGGQSVVEVFRVQVTDKAGVVSDTQEISVQVHGTADGPKLRGLLVGPVNVAQPSVAGVVPVLDHDIGDQHTFTLASPGQGAMGTLTLSADGHYHYQLDPASAKQIALGEGQQVSETFMVTVADRGGRTFTRQLTVEVQGTNDAPTIKGALVGAVDEDAAAPAHGRLTLGDPDAGDTVTLASHQVQGQFGLFAIGDDGQWTYTLDNQNPAVQALGAGATLTERVPVTVHDQHGLASTQEVLITIRGTNDVPVVSGQVSGAVAEDGATQAVGGQLTTTDADAHEHTTWSAINAPGTYGAFTLGADGVWHYQLNNASNAVQSLAAGQVVTEHFIAHGTDGHGGDVTQTIEVRVTGANDAARITGQITGAVTEDHAGGLAASGRLMLSDVDAGQGQLLAQTLTGQHGTLKLLADGSWSYTGNNADPAVQALGAGKTLTDTLNVATPEGGTQAITITFTGVNDRAVIAGVSTGAVTEDSAVSGGKITTSGQLTVTDIDTGEAHFTVQADVAGSKGYGHFSIDATGQWTYTADNSDPRIQALGAHNTPLTDSLAVTSADGTRHTLTVTLTGSNDAPVLHAQTQSVTEAGRQLSGNLRATDADIGDTLTYSTAGHVAGFTLDADGSYRFDPKDAAYQHIPDGHSEVLTVPVTVTDSQGATSTENLVITITGANDGALIAGTGRGTVTEDVAVTGGSITTSGQLTVTDVDTGEAGFIAQTDVAGSKGYGHFSIDATGQWTYRVDNGLAAVQQLNANQHLVDTLVVHSADGTASTVTVTIQGTNDGPTVTATPSVPADLGATPEDTARTFTQADLLRLAGATDADGDTLSISAVTVDAQYGAFSRQANGDWLFTPAADAHHDDIPLTLTVSDGRATATAQAVLDIKPVTDAARAGLGVVAEQHVMEFHAGHAGAVMHDGALRTNGDLTSLAIELTVIGGPQVTTRGIHGATLVSYASSGTADGLSEFYIWKPESLIVRVGGREYDTGVNMGADADSHRWSFVWSGTAGTLDVLRDGQVIRHMDAVAQGYRIPGGGKLAFGNDQDTLGGGYSLEDGWHGQMFSATAGTGVSAAQLAQQPLRNAAQGDALFLDIQAQGGGLIDNTGHHAVSAVDGITTPVTMVDTRLANPLPGALLHLNPNFVMPTDSADQVSGVSINGLPAGTVLSDGQGHSHTFSGTLESWPITGWAYANLTAQLPPGSHDNANIGIQVITAGPNGEQLASYASTPVVVDASRPVPSDALVTGDDRATVDEDAPSVAGVLHVSDATAADAHFAAQDSNGNYGHFRIGSDGHWSYAPDDRADALAAGEQGADHFTVLTADGTRHEVNIALTGTDDGVQVAPAPLTPPPPPPPDHAADAGDGAAPDSVSLPLNEGHSPTWASAGTEDQHQASPLADYLHFADTAHDAAVGASSAEATASPLDGYLAAAGVDPASISPEPADLPPTEVLVEALNPAAGQAAEPTATHDGDAALAAMPPEALDQPPDEPLHHGV